MHERPMQLRGKVFGRQRTILGKDPAGMDAPIQIDKDLYFEAKFDTEALLTMMEKKVLEPVGYGLFRNCYPIYRKETGDIRKPEECAGRSAGRGTEWRDDAELEKRISVYEAEGASITGGILLFYCLNKSHI